MLISKHKKEKKSSNVVQEFSRFAHQYDTYNVIQAQVAKKLVFALKEKQYNTVLDLGCGSGEVFKNFKTQHIACESFVALDSAASMLERHPLSQEVQTVCADFNQKNFLDALTLKHFDLLISASALQWSEDLDFTLGQVSKLSETFYGSFFTSGTFKTLHQTASIHSPIYTAEKIKESITKHYRLKKIEIQHYRLEFESTREMFKYIKQSGVSAGERKLSYKQTKKLMESYPLKYLEFEVLFVEAQSLWAKGKD